MLGLKKTVSLYCRAFSLFIRLSCVIVSPCILFVYPLVFGFEETRSGMENLDPDNNAMMALAVNCSFSMED